MIRVYLQAPIAEGADLNLPDAAAHHVAQVLRMRAGAALMLFNGDGGEYAAEITACERRRVAVRVLRHVEGDRESRLAVTLAQCVSKGERMDYTLQKAVELGACAIVPVLSSRSVVRLDAERWQRKLEHWRGVIVSACEQSGRTRIPPLADVQMLEPWLAGTVRTQVHVQAHSAEPEARLLLAPGTATTLRGLPPAARITLLVGPEGGLSEDEILLAIRHGFSAIGLGPRVLRTETAGVAALAALQTLWGDLG